MPLSPVQAERRATVPRVNALIEAEQEVINHFVEIARALGQPWSYAQIYGLLFVSPRPLTLDEICTRLGISKGSGSMGLAFLRELGAVQPVERAGQRRTRYQAVAELRRLAACFLRDRIGPQLVGGEDQLQRLTAVVGDLPEEERAHVQQRVLMLQSWNKNMRRIMPLAVKLLGG